MLLQPWAQPDLIFLHTAWKSCVSRTGIGKIDPLSALNVLSAWRKTWEHGELGSQFCACSSFCYCARAIS